MVSKACYRRFRALPSWNLCASDLSQIVYVTGALLKKARIGGIFTNKKIVIIDSLTNINIKRDLHLFSLDLESIFRWVLRLVSRNLYIFVKVCIDKFDMFDIKYTTQNNHGRHACRPLKIFVCNHMHSCFIWRFLHMNALCTQPRQLTQEDARDMWYIATLRKGHNHTDHAPDIICRYRVYIIIHLN